MTGFGGLNPLPLRLGGDAETGWTAAQYLRVCADTIALLRNSPFARLKIDTLAITWYSGHNGIGLAHAPTCTGASPIVLTWPTYWVDDLGVEHPVNIRSVKFSIVADVEDASAQVVAPNVVHLWGTNFYDLTIFGSDLATRTLAEYEAYSDKEDTKTELVPYAWSSYRALQDARGSAYSTEKAGLVHVENLVLARGHAARWRDAERLSSNANPATATELQSDWQKVLGVTPRADDTPESLRARCAAKFQVTLGPTQQVIDDSIASILGRFYVRTWRSVGADLDTPPTATYWPGVNPGPASYDLGGGAWISERSSLFVEVTTLADSDLIEFNAKIEQMAELLDRVLPAYETWDWGANADDGFTLDVDLLDEGTMTP